MLHMHINRPVEMAWVQICCDEKFKTFHNSERQAWKQKSPPIILRAFHIHHLAKTIAFFAENFLLNSCQSLFSQQRKRYMFHFLLKSPKVPIRPMIWRTPLTVARCTDRAVLRSEALVPEGRDRTELVYYLLLLPTFLPPRQVSEILSRTVQIWLGC